MTPLTPERIAELRRLADRHATVDPGGERRRLAGQLARVVPALLVEVERLGRHSVALNSVGWQLAVALGDVADDSASVEAAPADLVARLVADRDQLRAEVKRLRRESAGEQS